ncbi:UDP-4-amino-4,6-dideoxy-N-acetyl-beta-L-altrosamine transaminase [Heliobacterium gestii]|uniref:UDP-4-amino-4, 6-dideoxy-N-acetyl-beta-L-altrosamine transaminase n=1 Tax=Heliomicrobium gestii TaxID=2699 RepID=A0A845LJE5_HELGE|nr:UDP-4-amino-4,6-dideoxy-N-acetyl-beta-L-altrosamine transaminase [Heliomicrobium gestii]MBM7866724.1 UDP-4-amino-4,6-dideoxy-N-acetyl-beta-L-altrosamine transaminase [Heliomicrobium gestii]MZP42996.1 UDP-4-amino-4,6-dideoxy-N-acetyl-beta-L-altrosamine transaminase [Heliomicrobium gestii]
MTGQEEWIPYARQSIDEEDIAAVAEALRGDYLTTGPAIDRFEAALARRVGARFGVAVSSGTAALHAAYFAAGIGPGDEVIVPANTFAATANAALYLGAKPVFADIEPDTGNVDVAAVASLITERTRAIVPVHFAGLPADIAAIRDMAERYGLPVIEDAAHALGAAVEGRPVGSLSAMTTLSFHPVKHIATGEGGMVVTDDEELYRKLVLFRSHGITRDRAFMEADEGAWYYEMHALGYNYRMTDIQAVLGESQLKKLDRFLDRRREIADRYDRELACLNEAIALPGRRRGRESAWHLYVIRVVAGEARRKAFVDYLRERGILVNVHYRPVYLHPYYRNLGYGPGLCPAAERFYSQAVSLPMYAGLTESQQARVIEAVIEGAKAT